MGSFRLDGRLGQGGQGVVYLGADPGGGRVAVKVMTGEIDRSFARELAAARKVDEFCTARVLVADLDHDPPYVASEYIEGPALSTAVGDSGPLRGAALTRLAIGTITALAAIHRAGVVHRDFKPGNVLLGPDGPRVIDFGIARLVDATATGGGAVGTPPYMSPEQFSADPIGPPSDVFAWASTITYAATGRPPFGADTFAAVAYRILHDPPDLGDVPDPLRSILARCLAKSPDARPTARTVLLELLGEPPSHPPEDAGSGEVAVLNLGAQAAAGPVGRPSRLPRRALLGAGAAAVAAALTGGVLWWRLPLTETAEGPPPTPGSTDLAAHAPSSPAQTGTSSPSSTPPSTPAASATPSRTPEADPPVEPPSRDPTVLALAVATAATVAPLADMSFSGGMSQSSFSADARGRVRYHSDEPPRCDFALNITDYSEGAKRADVTYFAGPADERTYVNRKRLAEEQKHFILEAFDMISTMSDIAVIVDLVSVTRQTNRAGRRYSGGLRTPDAPDQLKSELQRLTGWEESELKPTTLTWSLDLDTRNRPRSFTLSWRYNRLTSTFGTTYARWRDGEIPAPS